MKVYWLSRHALSPAQAQAIRDLHGEDAEVVKDSVVFKNIEGLADYIRKHPGGFVYAVAGAPHCIHAALTGCRFGVFENDPAKRRDGTFGLAAVYHVGDNKLQKVWVNPNPNSNKDEAVIPVTH